MIVDVHERRLPASTEHIGAACHRDDVRYPVTEHQPGPRVSFAVTGTDLLGGHGFDVMEEGGFLPPPPHAASAPQPLDAILWPLMVRSVRGSILKDLLDNRLVS